MSARAIIGVRTEERRFKGVFHLNTNEPWVLGDHLLSRVIRARGDIGSVVEEVVHGAPYGWVSLLHSERNQQKKGDNKRLFTQNILKKDIAVDWIYLFDVDTRTLTISSAERAGSNGIAEEPFMVVNFSDRGRPDPRQIIPPPHPWPALPVAEGWEGDLGDLVPVRQRSLDITDEWCENVGLSSEQLAKLIGASISGLLDTHFSEDVGEFWVAPELHENQTYWSVDLWGRTLHYPCAVWRDALRASKQVSDEHDRLQVWTREDVRKTINLSPRNLLSGYEGFNWPFDDLEPEETIAVVLRGVASGLYPESEIDSEGVRVFRWMKLVEEITNADRESLFVEGGQEAGLGEESQNTLLFRWKWDLLDWLRASQLTGAGD
jgi:hypothetical protein